MTADEIRALARKVAASAPPLTDNQRHVIRLAFARPSTNPECARHA
ncbi:hypothetical protein [Gordonia sp. DT101]